MTGSEEYSLTRRTMIAYIGSFIAGHLLGCASVKDEDYLIADRYIRSTLKVGKTPGIAVCVVRDDRIVWSAGYGWADIANRKPMTPDTIQNIASVSKTITTTAVMQLWEQAKLGLDDDVNDYLRFSVRNPRYPDIPITFRQLLTHTSSITDGPAFDAMYACGDPTVSLMDWLQSYYEPAGSNYDAEKNFLPWPPGTLDPPRQISTYCNLAFGLLGGLVERITGLYFAEYCRQKIFNPLGMNDTGWNLTDIDVSRHAVPYGSAPDPRVSPAADTGNLSIDSKYYERCLYSFTNYPDGLLRTSVNDLSKFLRAYIGRGEFESVRILRESTVRTVLTESHDRQGLCWRRPRNVAGDSTIWGHDGGDPGVSTAMAFSQRQNKGVVVLSNYDGWDLVEEASKRLFQETADI